MVGGCIEASVTSQEIVKPGCRTGLFHVTLVDALLESLDVIDLAKVRLPDLDNGSAAVASWRRGAQQAG